MAVNNIPNASFKGIVLTCQTSQGPLIVYSYPPDCSVKSSNYTSTFQANDDDNLDTPTNQSGAGHDDFQNLGWPNEDNEIFSSDFAHDHLSNSLDTNFNGNLENSFNEFSLLGPHKLEQDSSMNANNLLESSDFSDGSDIVTDYANYSSDASSMLTDNEDSGGISLIKSANNQSNLGRDHNQSNLGRDHNQQQVNQQQDTKKRSNTVVSKETLDSSIVLPDASEYKIFQEFCERYPADRLNFTRDKICGLDREIIAEYCLPPRHLCNRKFEFTCDELSFIGLPIASKNADGTWSNPRKEPDVALNSARKEPDSTLNSARKEPDNSLNNSRKEPDVTLNNSRKESDENGITEPADLNADFNVIDDAKSNTPFADIKSQTSKRSHTSATAMEGNIFIFNIVFILDPLLVEYDQRVDEMYDYVVTRFALFLRFVQHESNYLTKEVDLILNTNQQFSNMSHVSIHSHYKHLLMKSSLCRAITKCFHRISDNKVANLVIDDDKFISLQIPIRNEFKYLPNTKIDHVLKGSFLTSIDNLKFLTASNFNDKSIGAKNSDTEVFDEAEIFNYALLFLMDPQDIINDLNTNVGENDLSTLIMSDLVSTIKPYNTLKSYKKTMQSLIQKYTNEHVSDDAFIMNMLKSFVLHFIYWRQARCIIPISTKNKYIVSPLAPMTGHSIDDFDSNIHYSKPADKLALFYSLQLQFKERFSLLPNLSTFLSYFNGEDSLGIHIPSKEHRLLYFEGVSWCIQKGILTQILTFVYLRVDSKIKSSVEEDLEKEGFLNKKATKKNSDEYAEYSISNAFSSRKLSDAEIRTNSNKSDAFSSEHDDDLGDSESVLSLESFEDASGFTIILEPRTSTAIEKRWLYKLVESDFSESEQKLFYRLLKYFNGQTSLEFVCLKNKLNRNEINHLISKLDKYVVKVKHW